MISSEDKSKILVLFDVGNVLLKTDFGRFYEEAAKLSTIPTPGTFAAAYRALEVEFLSGIDTQVYLTKLREMISPKKEIDVSDDQLIEVVCYMWKEAITDVINLKRRVHQAGYSVGIFSNLPRYGHDVAVPELHPEILETYDSSPSVFSFEVGCVKPDSKMYQRMAELIAEQGYEKVIFIDDNESYVRKGIDDFGWCGIWFPLFMDKAEASKPIDESKAKPSKNLRHADSIEELINSLKYFGVNI